CGRRAESLEAYQRARQVLVAELGLEPGSPLRTLQGTILADGQVQSVEVELVPPRMVPAQLPADVPYFTGRDEQLKQLDKLLSTGDDPAGTAVVISAIA